MTWISRSLALGCGLLLTLAFAPWNFWCLGLVCPAVLIWLWSRAPSAREGAWLGFAFGVGTYAAGTWWLYIAIRVFGQAPVWVALVVMGALVLIMAAYQAALGYVVVRWLAARRAVGWLLLVPAAWVLLEWWRGWFLSGFPWLSLGYSQTDTWLVGLAPVGGVHLISAALLIGAGALVTLLEARGSLRAVALVALVLPWTLGLSLRAVQWTQAQGGTKSIAILQGAVPQDMKWLESNQQKILDDYAALNTQAQGADLIVWPESALPDVANVYAKYIGDIWSDSDRAGSGVLMGVMRQDDDGIRYFNSVLALGKAEPHFYDKTHLVPFGEYFPVPHAVREWLRLMSLPNSDFNAGANDQPALSVAGMKIAASICFEDSYPTSLHVATRESGLLANVTNDAWFGKSGARYQHLQIARMRAIEGRRFLVRAANDGVSAIIGPSGAVVAQAPEFKQVVLRGNIQLRNGTTPYLVVGNYPVIGAAVGLLAIMLGGPMTRRRRSTISQD
ncbi:MAG: apolipoprotein N-acyltransferase [Pseudomonadota bacterium]